MNKAKLDLKYEDGTEKNIILEKVIEINVPNYNEICFRETKDKTWIMTITNSMLKEESLLADDFLQVSKIES